MNALLKSGFARLLAFLLPVSVALLQAAPVAHAQDRPTFTQQELDQMLAPIALYPDPLLSQALMASTYPLEVVQAARWSKAHPDLKGEEAVKAVEQMNWDPSVKSLVAFPQVLATMDENLGWTEKLGNAFLAQREQLMNTVQSLRHKAQAAGNLQSSDRMRVEQQGEDVLIEPADPRLVYVPYYDPRVAYGPWPWPAYPPVYWWPPAYYFGPSPVFFSGFGWWPGIAISAGFFFGRCDWPHHQVTVVNVNNFFFRNATVTHQTTITQTVQNSLVTWQHDPLHRRGVPLPGAAPRQQFTGTGVSVAPSAVPSAGLVERRDMRPRDPSRPVGRPEPPVFHGAPPLVHAVPPAGPEMHAPHGAPPLVHAVPPAGPEMHAFHGAPPLVHAVPLARPEMHAFRGTSPLVHAVPPAPVAPNSFASSGRMAGGHGFAAPPAARGVSGGARSPGHGRGR